MLSAYIYELWADRDLYHATPGVTRDLGFSYLFRRSALLVASEGQIDNEDVDYDRYGLDFCVWVLLNPENAFCYELLN